MFALMASEAYREAVESMLAGEVERLGGRAVPAHALLDIAELGDRERVRAALREAAVGGVLLLRPVAQTEQARYVPGVAYFAGAPYDSLWSYWGYQSPMLLQPGHFETDTTTFVEALYFSVQEHELLWGGVSEVSSTDELAAVMRRMANDTAKEMRRSGFIRR